jgi:hypothetical protein
VVGRVATDPAGPTAGAPHPARHAHPARAPRTGSPHALAGEQQRAQREARPIGGAAWCHSRPGSGRARGRRARRRAPVFPRPGGAAGPDRRAVDPPWFPVQLVTRVKLGAQRTQ